MKNRAASKPKNSMGTDRQHSLVALDPGWHTHTQLQTLQELKGRPKAGMFGRDISRVAVSRSLVSRRKHNRSAIATATPLINRVSCQGPAREWEAKGFSLGVGWAPVKTGCNTGNMVSDQNRISLSGLWFLSLSPLSRVHIDNSHVPFLAISICHRLTFYHFLAPLSLCWF